MLSFRTGRAVAVAVALVATACGPDSGVVPVDSLAAIPAGSIVPLVDLTEFTISGDLDVPEGHVVIDVLNTGSAPHNLKLTGGAGTPELAAGQGAFLDLGTLSPGAYELFCDVAGHRAAGMVTSLNVVPESEADTVEISTVRSDEPDYAKMDEHMLASVREFPAETEGKGNIPLEPEVLADGTKVFDLTLAITPWEVSPGKFVDAWTYNGMVPGPEIRVDVGDKVRVNVQNDLPAGTDIHWHGVSVPNDQDGVAPITQELIRPGEKYVYEFTAKRQAMGMYHAHHMGMMTVPNGLFGAITVGETPVPRGKTVGGKTIPADLKVAREIPMVLNDAGVIGYSLNGKSFPATEPYVANVGDWMVATYYNEGLLVHPMHLHQFDQLVFAKDGFALDNPYWADTVNVAPGERYSVLFQITDPGTWVWHCHILTHVESEDGMFGMVTAIVAA